VQVKGPDLTHGWMRWVDEVDEVGGWVG
jgi:hypothetical protein